MAVMPPSSSEDPAALLVRGASELGITLAPAVLDQFALYLSELKRWNARVNLTGLKTDWDIVLRHFLDSLALLALLDTPQAVADIGSGAGFPGLVLKLVRPELRLTLVESRGKKAAFLDYLTALLHLSGVEVIQVRLTPRLAAAMGPHFDLVVSRAALRLRDLVVVAAPLLIPGGRLMALKGPNLPDAELKAANLWARKLGLEELVPRFYQLPVSGERRLVVQGLRPPAPAR